VAKNESRYAHDPCRRGGSVHLFSGPGGRPGVGAAQRLVQELSVLVYLVKRVARPLRFRVRVPDGPLVTCEAVNAESCHLLARLPGAAEDVLENVRRGIFQIPFTLAARAAEVKP
jgi:hypothetical protein